MRKLILLPTLLVCLAGFVSAGALDIDGNLVVYYKFNETLIDEQGNYTLDLEGTGIESYDDSAFDKGFNASIENRLFNSTFSTAPVNNDFTIDFIFNTSSCVVGAGSNNLIAYYTGGNDYFWVRCSETDNKMGSLARNGGGVFWSLTGFGSTVNDGALHHVAIIQNTSNNNMSIWLDGSIISSASSSSFSGIHNTLIIGARNFVQAGVDGDATIDELAIWSVAKGTDYVEARYNSGSFAELTMQSVEGLPILSGYNCTSCSPPNGDNESPYTTEDTTPTFTFTTDENAWCRIGDEDQNYTTMGSSRDCTSGEGTMSHTCTLTVQDELLINETDYVYIGCKDAENNENQTSSSGPLQMGTSQLETGVNAIMAGINSSVIWPATVYSNQQVYLRDVNNNQTLVTFDRVAVSGNQRWAFNYLNYNDSFLSGLFNITPIFYAAEFREATYQDVNNSIRLMIDSTKK